MTLQEVIRLASDVAPRAIQVFGGAANELAYRSVIISAVETEKSFDQSAKNPTSSARGLMQTTICTQRFMEEKLAMPFQPAMFSTRGTYCAKLYEKKEPAKVSVNADYVLATPKYGMLIGASYLAYQIQRYNDIDRAIVAFNRGNYSTAEAKKAAAYLAKYKRFEAELGGAIRQALNSQGQQQPLARATRRNDDIRTLRGILEFI